MGQTHRKRRRKEGYKNKRREGKTKRAQETGIQESWFKIKIKKI